MSSRKLEAKFGAAYRDSRPVEEFYPEGRPRYGRAFARKWNRVDRRRARALNQALEIRRQQVTKPWTGLTVRITANLEPIKKAFEKLALAWRDVPPWQRDMISRVISSRPSSDRISYGSHQ